MSAEDMSEVLRVFEDLAVHVHDARGSTKSKPILGGSFGEAGFALTSILQSMPHSWMVVYCVVHLDSGVPISISEDKAQSLSIARKFLGRITPSELRESGRRVSARLARREDERISRIRAEAAAMRPALETKVPKRRQQVFDKSGGKCHYCATPLTLDGRWHIEHKMPRALLGGSEMHNLVASCASCNHRKKDKTDLEFIALQQERAAT